MFCWHIFTKTLATSPSKFPRPFACPGLRLDRGMQSTFGNLGHAKGLGNFAGLVGMQPCVPKSPRFILVNICQLINIPWRPCPLIYRISFISYYYHGYRYSISPTSIHGLGLWKKLFNKKSSFRPGHGNVLCLCMPEDSPIHIMAFLCPHAAVTKAYKRSIFFHGYFPDVKRNACYPSISAFRSGPLKSSLQVLKKLPGFASCIYIYI